MNLCLDWLSVLCHVFHIIVTEGGSGQWNSCCVMPPCYGWWAVELRLHTATLEGAVALQLVLCNAGMVQGAVGRDVLGVWPTR